MSTISDILIPLGAALFLQGAIHASAQTTVPPSLTTGVEIIAGGERTTLDRPAERLRSSLSITVRNTGDRLIEPPFHAVLTFMPQAGGTLGGLVVEDVLGGIGVLPYQTFYKDLSVSIGTGLPPGGEARFDLAFSRPRTSAPSYRVELHGIRNGDPVAIIGGPYAGLQDAIIAFDGSASSDPDNDTLTFGWEFGDGATGSGAKPEHAYAAPGLYTATLTVGDGRGAEATRETQVTVLPPGDFALARTRTLDGNGHPLGGVVITQAGPGGALTASSDPVSGFASLGGESGGHAWKFESPGHLTAYRRAELLPSQVKVLPFPWMSALESERTALSVLNPTTVASRSGKVSLVVPPEAFGQIETVTVTDLHGQSLPLPLPPGWSPLSGFYLDLPEEAEADIATALRLADSVSGGDGLALVRLDTEDVAWKVESLPVGNNSDRLDVLLRKPGSYAVVVADTLPGGNPGPPEVGQDLLPGAAPLVAPEVAAVGVVDPVSRSASRNPDLVTAAATVAFTNAAQPLASGAWFFAAVEETYDLRDGQALKAPDYDATFYAYQRPGDSDGTTAAARFPLRPRILFGPDELTEARLRVDVLALGQFNGGVVGPTGGLLSLAGVRVGIPAGAVGALSAAEIRQLPVAGLSRFLGEFSALLAFELNLPELAEGTVLDFLITKKLPVNGHFVLARCVGTGTTSGLQPVQRFRSDVLGRVTDAEPPVGPRLPGVTVSGQYVLVQLGEPQALVTGLVQKAGNSPLAAALVRVIGEPWLSITGAGGNFATLSRFGAVTVTALDPLSADSGQATATLADASDHADVEITVAPSGPRVVSTTPAHEAVKVSAVTPVTVVFSEPIAPASLGTNGVTLSKEGETTAVAAAVSLNNAGTVVSLFPGNPLDAGVPYVIAVAATITDPSGLPLEGQAVFRFTVAPPENRGEGGQLVIYEPGAVGPTPAHQTLIDAIPGYEPGTDREKVVAVGSAGTADPGVPVILVNESTGTTATVLSKQDGSFANFIEATEEDFISAVFVNANGTRVTIPATRQLFDDGRVGLYNGGGILEAESDGGGAQVIVEPQSVPARTVFRVGRATVQETLEITKGVQPEDGRILGGVRFEEAGDPTRIYSDLVFPVDVADIGLPPGADPATATFALTVPREINGSIVFEVVDGMTFRPTEPGKGELVTQSPPFVGLLLREIAALRAATGLTDGIKELVSRTIASGTITALIPVGIFVVPVFVTDLASTNIHGNVYVETPPAAGAPEGTQASRVPLAGAVIRLAANQAVLQPDVFRAGDFVATSDREGRYAMFLPSLLTKAVAATHRRFPGQTVRSGVANAGLIVGIGADLIFRAPAPASLDIAGNAPPSISVRQLSLVATVGEAPEAGIVLDELVIDDIAVTSTSGPKLISFTSLVGTNSIEVPVDEKALLEGAIVLDDTAGFPATVHRQWHVQSKRSGRATYEFEAADAGSVPANAAEGVVESGIARVRYTVVFSTAAAPPGGDGQAPRVVSFAWPPDGAEMIARGTPLIVRFSRALDDDEVAALSGDAPWLVTETPGTRILHFEVSPDRREVKVAYWLTDPAVSEIAFVITDLMVAQALPKLAAPEEEDDGTPLDQFRHTFSFGAGGTLETGDDAMLAGTFGGIVHQGAHVWALERGQEGGKLLHYEITRSGTTANLVRRPDDTFEFAEGTGRPMDIVLIPGYALRLGDGSTSAEGNYLVVFAGRIIGNDPSLPAPKRAHIFRISPTGKPEPYLVRGDSPVLSSTISLLTRGRWDPPFLSYMEIGETTPITLVTFNGLVREAEDRKQLLAQGTFLTQGPPPRVDGIDLDNDGDFADDNEKAPNRGFEFSWEPLDPGERVVDYDFSADYGLMGAALRPTAGGDNIFAMVLGGSFGQVDDLTARVSFPHAAKRIKILPRQRLVRPATSQTSACAQLFAGTNEQSVVRDIALISCLRGGATGAGEARAVLVVIDITDPRAPVCLATAAMPLGISAMNSIVPRADGLLAVSATGGGLFLLDPTLLLVTGPDGETAALREQIPGLESNVNTFASGADGFHFANEGNKIRAAVTQPTITVFKPRFQIGGNPLNSSLGLANEVRMAALPVAEWNKILSDFEATGLGGNAGIFDPEHPDDPERHFYVVVQASGLSADANGNLPLAAAAVTSTGRPLLPSLTNRAPTFVGETSITKALVGYAAIKAAHFLAKVDFSGDPADIALSVGKQLVDEATANFFEGGLVKAFLDGAPDYADELMAHRLSDDPTSPLFNTYVAGPIVLLHRDAPKEMVDKNNALGRVALRASPFYWVGLAPTLGTENGNDPFVGTFASKQRDELDLSLNASLGKVKEVATKTGEALVAPTHPIVTLTQIALQLSTLVSAEFERTFEPGHVALVNFGFRRNPVVFIPGVMASRLINPGVEGPAGLRWLSLATGARAHAREFLGSLAPDVLKDELCDIDAKLNARMADLSMLPSSGPGGAQPVATLDTEDILRTVGLGDIIEDIASDSVFEAFSQAINSVLNFFGVDFSFPLDPSDPVVKFVLNKINKPIYEPLLLYLEGYLGMDEYKNNGRGAALRRNGSPNWKSLRAAPELFVFPYDWRLDNATNATKLELYVDLINLVQPDSPKVDIVCHSMGGLVARRFVMDNPNRVDRFISVASPYLGATKTLNAMKTGDMGEMAMSIAVPQPRMRILTRHMPAVHQLLPSKGLLDLGLPVLRENGWDLDGDGDAYENLDYDEYRTALDGGFFRIPEDEIDESCPDGASQEVDRMILKAQPHPIVSNSEPFHFFATNAGSQDDWSGDQTGVRYTHFVCLQNEPATLIGLEARPVLIPEELKPDISLSLPPVDFFDSEERVGNDLILFPEVTRALETDPEKTFRISWITDTLSGGGDGTVPLLSQTRGFGITGGGNAPGALMFPILNPKSEGGDDAMAGHNDCMRNPQLWAWVGKALQDEIVAGNQPTLTISGGGGSENQPITFTAEVEKTTAAGMTPEGRSASTQRIVWDMGDGAVLLGPEATHTYSRAGTYTVSCTVAYEPGALLGETPEAPSPTETIRDVSRRPTFGAVTSKRITIANNDPALTIEGPDTVAAGALSTFRLNLAGRGSEDGRRFSWDFGDGTPVDPSDADNYVAQHAYLDTGDFTITARLTAEDGTTAEATRAVTVALGAPAPEAPSPPVFASGAGGTTNDGSGELIEMLVTGHTADPDDIEIRNDGQLVHLGTRVASVSDGAEIFLPTQGQDLDTSLVPAAQAITIVREPSNVAQTTIRIHGEHARLLARFDYFKAGSPLRCWYHRFGYEPTSPFGSALQFTINWAQLPTLTNTGVEAIAPGGGDFTLHEAAVLPFCDERGPNINASFDDKTDEIVLRADDNAVLDGAPVGDGSDLPDEDAKLLVGLAWPPGAPAPEGVEEPCNVLEGTQVFQVKAIRATRDGVPGAVLAEDRSGLASMPNPADCPKKSVELTDQDIADVQNAVKETFRRATMDPLFDKFLLNKDHLLIFEQGSGALLWKATNGGPGAAVARRKLNGVYVRGKSDNDYELFLPVFTDGRIHSANPTPVEFAEFVTLAHQPDVMEGDWYFLPPSALSGSGLDMGPPPDPEDRDEYLRYVSAAAEWVYRPPGGLPEFQVAKGQPFPGQDPDDSVFNNPATPAQFLSALLTFTVEKDKPGLRDTLPDVSFFPFRREHFEMGMLSLEKPPPFGDDPIGDAGMGRQSLLLKWVLEGAFLPPFDGFNNAVPNDAALRAIVFDRLKLRQDLYTFEGFEWGIYQQWAVLREAAAFRMRPEGGAAAAARDRCRQVFGNYLDAHDDKVMKKLGKACIRAALGRMMTDDDARATVLAISPGGFDLTFARRSFEHVIVEAALGHLPLFEGFTETDLKRFLGAKLGDTMTFCEIRAAEGGIDAFTARCFDFLTAVQEATADAYTAGILQLKEGGRAPELSLRHENAIAIDRGFTGLGGDRFAGRAEMSGVAGSYEHRYSFVVSLTRNTSEVVGPLAVTLQKTADPADNVICLVPPFEVDEKVITLKHNDADKIPVLSILRAANDFSVTNHKISLDVPAAANGIPENDTACLEAELLVLPVELNEELVPEPGTRWVFRGLEFANQAEWAAVEAQQLQMGEFWSPSRVAGIADSVRRAEMLDQMEAVIAGGNSFRGYTTQDLQAMTEDQLLAVLHLGMPADSLGISTAERIETAVEFADFSKRELDEPNPNYSVLVAMEVPLGEGVEYVNTSITTPEGAPVPRTFNPGEGDEVVFYGTVPYVRLLAWSIRPAKTPAIDGDQDTRLRPYEVLEFLGEFRGNP